MVIAVLEGDLMGNPCWVEGVGAISRPSGTLSYRFLSFFLFLSFFFLIYANTYVYATMYVLCMCRLMCVTYCDLSSEK